MTTLQSGGSDGVVWLSISDLAKRKGIHRQSAKERVDRLEAKGLIETKLDGRSRMVDLAAFDRAVGQTGDAAKEQGAETKRETVTTDTSPKLRDAQADRATYEARLKALDLSERLGQLLPVKGDHGVERAMIRSAEATVRALDQIPSWAAELMSAARDGQPAMMRVLRAKRFELRKQIAAALTALADEGARREAAGGTEIDIANDEA